MEENDELFLKPPESNFNVISLKINGDILSSLNSNDKKITFVSHGDSGIVSILLKTLKNIKNHIFISNHKTL
jgi:hypothetical protein